MTFKANWEKAETQHELPEGIIPKMVAALYPAKKIKAYHIISGGCANINIKVELQEDEFPFILRVYLRDVTAASREQKLANILVNKVNGDWKISGILDWEFAFSGSTLHDAANMLRYAHHMPKEYSASFLDGLQSGGIHLPKDWRITIDMLNLLALLDCLKRSNSEKCPNQTADILELIAEILTRYNQKCL